MVVCVFIYDIYIYTCVYIYTNKYPMIAHYIPSYPIIYIHIYIYIYLYIYTHTYVSMCAIDNDIPQFSLSSPTTDQVKTPLEAVLQQVTSGQGISWKYHGDNGNIRGIPN